MSDFWYDGVIVIVANVVGITNAFVCHKCFTYCSHGSWWVEYLRFYVVYGLLALANIALIAIFVTLLRFNAYVIQFFVAGKMIGSRIVMNLFLVVQINYA